MPKGFGELSSESEMLRKWDGISEQGRKERSKKVLRHLENNPGRWYTAYEVSALTGTAFADAWVALQKLSGADWIYKDENGNQITYSGKGKR